MNRQPSLFDDPEPWELDAREEALVAQVVFAEPPFGPYDYAVPADFPAFQPGQRVQVPLGKGNRLVSAWCVDIASKNEVRTLKAVANLADDAPLLSPAMLRLTRWMSEYYLCPWGQVLQGVVPFGVRGQAGTREMTFLSLSETIRAQCMPRFESTALATAGSSKPKPLQLASHKISPKQEGVLRCLYAATRPLTPPELSTAAECGLGPIQELRKKGLIQTEVRRIQQLELQEAASARQPPWKLNSDQAAALEVIHNCLRELRAETILLHGVTGSGKTEVYIQAIEEVVRYGRQAIVLVPEISLTPQTRQRFRSRFDRVAVMHSHLSDAERHWHWQQIASGNVQVVVGARSAVFAPTPQLGLIVIDEEHDPSFKQGESPRYHARDVALERSRNENVPLVLGSATPSLESYLAAKQEKFRLVELPQRVEDRPLPYVHVLDLRLEMQNRMTRGAVSRALHQAIDQALQAEGQVILLLNRRGYATHIQCSSCGEVVKCPACDLSLTHHREADKVICHYCDHEAAAPVRCPHCQFDGIRFSGFGTERLEQEIKSRFPQTSVLRMDSDTMQKPGSHEKALDLFRAGEVKILLGTQMIAKGLDFPNVTLVGVINADTALHFPDFRAAERTFQLVTQVAGRTGRGAKGGEVLVQTFSPEHYAIQAAVHHDYRAFAEQDLPIRERLGYPPYGSLLRIIIRSEEEMPALLFADSIASQLRQSLETTNFEHRILGPAPCPIARLRGKFRFHVLLAAQAGLRLRELVGQLLPKFSPPENVQFVVDVDPIDLL